MKNNTPEEIYKKLKDSKKVLISLHTGPDGDSLGSASAMKYFLKREFGTEAILISADYLDEVLSKIDFSSDVNFGKDILDFDLRDFDVLLAIDCGIPQMIGKLKKDKNFLNDIFTINIDHHDTNDYYGNLNFVLKNYPSASSVIIKLLKENNIEFDRELSRRLLLGVCTDAVIFTAYSQYDIIFNDIGFLISNGADYTSDVLEPVVLNRPLKLKKYFAYIVNNLKINEEKKFGYSLIPLKVTEELGLNLSEVRLGINEITDISGLDFVCTLTETKDYIKGSFRGKGKVDLSKIAEKLGNGGGHKNAAAFRLNMSLEEAEKEVLRVVKQS
jgi:bifunctional oligoribonuclease and PAP phosphatase NrnA